VATNIHHLATEFEGESPRTSQYPPGTCFDCQVVNVEYLYDWATSGAVLTQILRITGARGPDGNPIPYPSVPLEEAEPGPLASDS
jgi:hypothetical protein